MIKLTNVNKIYSKSSDKSQVLHNVNLEINSGEFVALVGASGSGKSTLLNIIGLLDNDFTGNYDFCGKDVVQEREENLANIRNNKIGFVFQNFSLLSQYPVWYNVALPLHYRPNIPDNIKSLAIDSLKQVGLSDLAERYPHELSGGQQQRVAIARAIIIKPDIILADEPTGSLDTSNGAKVIDLFKSLNKSMKTAVLLITHDQNLALRAERKITICDGKI